MLCICLQLKIKRKEKLAKILCKLLLGREKLKKTRRTFIENKRQVIQTRF